jgi:hypothetical protein
MKDYHKPSITRGVLDEKKVPVKKAETEKAPAKKKVSAKKKASK